MEKNISICKCNDCDRFFSKDDLLVIKTDLEDYHGVGSEFFQSHNYKDHSII